MIKFTKIVKKDKKNYMNPTRGIYVLHNRNGQFSSCHFLICVLKKLTSSNSFNVLGKNFHILGPRLDKLSDDVRYRKKMRNTSS